MAEFRHGCATAHPGQDTRDPAGISTPQDTAERAPRFRCLTCGGRDVRAERDDVPGGQHWWPGPTPPLWVLTCAGCGHSARGLRCGCGGTLSRSNGSTWCRETCTRCGRKHHAAWD